MQIEQKLADLRAEQAQGQQQLAQVDTFRNQIATRLIEVAGAMKVLEELSGPVPAEPEPVEPAPTAAPTE